MHLGADFSKRKNDHLGRRNDAWIESGEGKEDERWWPVIGGPWRNKNNLDGGHLAAEGEDDGHLQHEPERVADIVGAEILEALGAVAALQEERPSHGRLPEPLLQLPHLSREHQRRGSLQRALFGLQRGPVGVLRDLPRGARAPAARRPLARPRPQPRSGRAGRRGAPPSRPRPRDGGARGNGGSRRRTGQGRHCGGGGGDGVEIESRERGGVAARLREGGGRGEVCCRETLCMERVP